MIYDINKSRLTTCISFSIVIVGMYIFWFMAAPPRGEFALSDDWAYAQSIRHLLESGQLSISHWGVSTTIFPVTFGALFAKLLGGFSFTAIRYSTLFLSYVGCIALFDLLRQLNISRSSALLGTLTLIVNPIYAYLSYTLMTDISFFTLIVVSLSLYIRGVKNNSPYFLLTGSIFSALAYLSRQLGVAAPIGVTLFLIARDRRLDYKLLLLVNLIPFTTFVAHALWLLCIHGVPWGISAFAIDKSLKVFQSKDAEIKIIKRLLNGLLYLGIFTLPVFLAQMVSYWRDVFLNWYRACLFIFWLIILITYCIINFYFFNELMPYLKHIVNSSGIGELDLAGKKLPVTPEWVFWLITIIAPFAGAAQGALWTDLIIRFRRNYKSQSMILVITSVTMIGITYLNQFLWDRYLIVLIPAGLYLLLSYGPIKLRGWIIGLAVVFLMLFYTLVEMGDHMATKTASWKAGERLIASGIPAEDIDGGWEWTGWHEFESALPKAIANGQGNNLWAWSRITPNRFFLSFSPDKKYEIVDQVAYRSRLLNREGHIYVLKHPVMDFPSRGITFDIGSAKEGRLLLSGFSRKKKAGKNASYRWALGKEGRLIVDGIRLADITDIKFTFKASPFVINENKEMTLRTALSNKSVLLKPGLNSYSVILKFPPGNNMVIDLRYANAASPKSMGISGNTRVLSVKWDRVSLKPVN